MEGRQFEHFVVSFDDDDITPEKAHEVGREIAEFYAADYQVLMATHVDTGNLHNHYVLNSVNLTTGKKYTQNKEQLAEFIKYSNSVFEKHNLHTIKERSEKQEDTNYYWAKRQERSWKYELYLAIVNCMRVSNSKDDFIENMGKLGYGVRWEDERKYITFTTPNGKKCRNNRICPPERFTKDALLHHFEYNQKCKSESEQRQKLDALLTTVRLFGSLSNSTKRPVRKSQPPSLEGEALQEYLSRLEIGSIWRNLKNEQEELEI